jgi:serine/threonine protein kinase
MKQEQVGSRLFMAPELRDGRADEVKTSADIYSLGKVLYWMLSGGRVFDRENHRDSKWNLTRIRKVVYMEHVHQLLDWMIRLDPASRRPIEEVVINIERIFALMKNRYNPLSIPLQPCTYCGQGAYQRISEQAWFYLGIETAQVNKERFRVLRCDFCGHLQYFWVGQDDWIDRSKVPSA